MIPTQNGRCSKGKAMETAARMEKWKNELHVFPLFHNRLENSSQTTLRVSHSFHSFYYWFYCLKKEKKECDISNELKHVTFLKSFDILPNPSLTDYLPTVTLRA